MKLKNIILGLGVGLTTLAGCDKIAQPLVSKQVNSTLPSTPPDSVNNSATSGPYSYKTYKVLLEDCMGDQCPNCPAACKIADTIISPTGGFAYYNQVVMMEDNMGSFAVPGTRNGFPSYAFSTDYRCDASNNWCTLFNLTNATYPAGLINRLGWNQTNPNMNVNYPGNAWQDSITYIIQHTSQSVEINIHDSCWTNPRIIGVEFQVTFIKALPAGTYMLEPAIIEDKIVSWQIDGSLLSGYDSTFVHRNVLRGSFDGAGIGQQIPPLPIDSTWPSYQTYDFTKGEHGKAASWNMANCYIVAFVYNQSTQAVVQAEMVKVE